MNPYEAVRTYKESAIESAPPVKITRMLYEGALRFLDRAAASDPNEGRSGFAQWLARADAIVSELRMSLDHTHGGDASRDLERLYFFCETRIGDATVRRDVAPIADVKLVLQKLLDGWKHVELETTGRP